MTGFDLAFMLIFSGVALALGLIAEANKNRVETPEVKFEAEEDKRGYFRQKKFLHEILDVLPEHSIHHPVVSPLVLRASELAGQGDFSTARGLIEKARSHLSENIETLAFIKPLNKVFLASPVPEQFDREMRVASKSLYEERPDYLVNPFQKTCTCEWMQTLETSDFDVNDVRRVCRHQVEALADEGFTFDLDEAAAEILKSPYRSQWYTVIEEDDTKFVLGFDQSYDWVQVLMLEPKMKTTEFSFSLRERRWAYGDSPRGSATKVKTAIRRTFDFRGAR